MDTLSRAERSHRMSLVRSKNTKPELVVRRVVSRLGYHYRLHQKKLPGNPDMVFSHLRRVIFVHGCFWHRHAACKGDRTPKSRLDFWVNKLQKNRERDLRNLRKLNRIGWRYIVVWECQIKNLDKLARRIERFLGATR